MGRKPGYTKNDPTYPHVLPFRISDEMKAKIDKRIRGLKCSASEYCRLVLEEDLK